MLDTLFVKIKNWSRQSTKIGNDDETTKHLAVNSVQIMINEYQFTCVHYFIAIKF